MLVCPRQLRRGLRYYADAYLGVLASDCDDAQVRQNIVT
jgi:hypothetical protein